MIYQLTRCLEVDNVKSTKGNPTMLVEREIKKIEIAKGSRTVIKNSFNLFNKHIKFSTVDLFETHVIFFLFNFFVFKEKKNKTI